MSQYWFIYSHSKKSSAIEVGESEKIGHHKIQFFILIIELHDV